MMAGADAFAFNAFCLLVPGVSTFGEAVLPYQKNCKSPA